MGIPNGAADIATFGLSNTTNVSISANTEVNSIVFTPAASAYTITASNGTTGALTLSGAGIVNNSGIIQNFVTHGTGSLGDIIFTNNATAGSLSTFTNNGSTARGGAAGVTLFKGDSTAGNGTFINNGATTVSGAYSAGVTSFSGSQGAATAGNGTFINNGGLVSGGVGGRTTFTDRATAGNGTFVNNGSATSGAGGGVTFIGFFSTAANGTFINNGGMANGAGGGVTEFLLSTADSATLIANGGTGGGQGGTIFFEQGSTGGTCRVEVFGNGSLDISGLLTVPRLTIGSVEGSGNVFLGGNNLIVGSNNRSTIFSGVIQDSGQDGGAGGSLTKIGSGTLVLSGANTYTGDTNIDSGVLKVDGSINSNTFMRHGSTLAGTGTVNGNAMNRGTVSPGDAVGALTVHNYTQVQYATLMIQIAGASAGEFSVLNVLGIANLSGHLDPVLLNGFVPTIGESFTFLNYGGVNGTLVIFNRNIDNFPEHWEVSYFPTYATLTVAPGNVAVPDQGSTSLLLTFGLLALLTCDRRNTLRYSVWHKTPPLAAPARTY